MAALSKPDSLQVVKKWLYKHAVSEIVHNQTEVMKVHRDRLHDLILLNNASFNFSLSQWGHTHGGGARAGAYGHTNMYVIKRH